MSLVSLIKQAIPKQMNPIVVKELRQAVRSRFISGIFILFLIVELFGIAVVLATSNFTSIHTNYHAGRDAFHFLFVTLSGGCLLFIPAYAAIRLSIERWDNNLDLMYITTIKPRQVVRGKLFSAMVIASLLFSAAAPFMVFSYLLRGIDLPSIFIAIAFVFIYVAAVTQFMIFIACLPTSRAFKIVLGLVGLAGIFWSLIIVNMVGWEIIYNGTGSKFNDPDFWIESTITVIGIFLGVGMLQRLTVALISPPTANRSLPVRIYATVVWLITGIGTFCAAHYYSETEIILSWFFPSVIILCLSILLGLSERPQLSARVRATIPRNPILRRISFLFYNGPVGAVLWAGTLLLITFVTSFFIVASSSTFTNYISDWMFGMLSLVFYALAYGFCSLFIWRCFFAKRLKSTGIGVIAALLIAVGSILPSITALLVNVGYSWSPAWEIGNIFTVAKDDHIYTHLFFSSIFALVFILLNASWIARQFKNFVPPPVSPSPSSASENMPPYEE